MTDCHLVERPKVITVLELLSENNLTIPIYQRPYKWTVKHVNQLFSDIIKFKFKDKKFYRIGTIVFHQEKNTLTKNIVDGQQRTLTLILTAIALIEEHHNHEDLHGLRDNVYDLAGKLTFKSDISKANLRTNYQEIHRFVSRPEFSEDCIDFLLNRCEVVTFTLNDISEAFQFFDSQNARGRDLEPHDLLKAYHLREFGENDDKKEIAAKWEEKETSQMADLFAKYLYRIRNWTKGESARYFGKNDIHLFKGINIETIEEYPYIEHLRITHHFVDHYNGDYRRKIDRLKKNYPFHLDQIIINGRRFFEMTAYYHKRIASLNNIHCFFTDKEVTFDENANKILLTINNYSGMNRTGDKYVRDMFDCLLLCYIDKFGHSEISRAIEKIFIWAYTLRLDRLRVSIASIDNYVLCNNLFKLLKDSLHPSDFIQNYLPGSKSSDHAGYLDKIKTLFIDMGYYSEV